MTNFLVVTCSKQQIMLNLAHIGYVRQRVDGLCEIALVGSAPLNPIWPDETYAEVMEAILRLNTQGPYQQAIEALYQQ